MGESGSFREMFGLDWMAAGNSKQSPPEPGKDAEIARLKAENEALKDELSALKLKLKLSEPYDDDYKDEPVEGTP